MTGRPAPGSSAATSKDHANDDVPVECFCPVCGARLIQIRCKSVCRSPTCINRIVYTCCEF